MFKGTKAYLYKDSTVVINKNDIKNAKDKDFKEISLYLSEEFIKESAEELGMTVEISKLPSRKEKKNEGN